MKDRSMEIIQTTIERRERGLKELLKDVAQFANYMAYYNYEGIDSDKFFEDLKWLNELMRLLNEGVIQFSELAKLEACLNKEDK